jgi:hypothetical protein
VSDGSTADSLIEYLTEQGWSPSSEGPAGVMWSNGTDASGRVQIGVPRGLDAKYYAFVGVFDRLAAYENRPPSDVKRDVVYFGFDIAHLRAANEHAIGDSISLSTGATMTESARLMVRSSAATAERTRAEVRGHYTKSGNSYAKAARMGHTELGSYIVPIMVRVGGSDARISDTSPALTGMDPRTLRIESAERRVLARCPKRFRRWWTTSWSEPANPVQLM